MKIMRVEALINGVEDVAAGIRYFQDWGLPCVEKGASGAEFRMPSGQSIVIRPATDASLPAAGCTRATKRATPSASGTCRRARGRTPRQRRA